MGPVLSPNGSKVVFQALGHLYVKDLARLEGTAPSHLSGRALSSSTPRFSSDGQWTVVYTTWDDQDLGSVRVVSDRRRRRAAGPDPASRPLRRTELSPPTAAHVVYRKITGGYPALAPVVGRARASIP